MSTKDSLNRLVTNITGEEVKTQRITESLTELVKALDAGGYLKPTDDTISEIVDVLAEVLPEKIGGGVGVNYDISEGTLNKSTITVEGGVVVNIPDGVTTIGAGAFTNNQIITSVIIPNSVTTIEGGMPWDATKRGAFYGCTSLTSIAIGNSVTTMGSYTFGDCTSLTSITIGNSVTSIGDHAFIACTGLTSIDISNSVTSIGQNAFERCTGLTSITIPDSVTAIGASAFIACTGLTSITIGNNVTTIDTSTFRGCTSLTSITIPDSVTAIGGMAFFECTSLTDVYFTGTEEQWNAITIDSDNVPLLNATKHFNYTP